MTPGELWDRLEQQEPRWAWYPLKVLIAFALLALIAILIRGLNSLI